MAERQHVSIATSTGSGTSLRSAGELDLLVWGPDQVRVVADHLLGS